MGTPIAIIGGGGLGANLASVLIEQGYKDVLLIDDDESESIIYTVRGIGYMIK